MTLSRHREEGLLGGTKDMKTNPVFNDQPFKLGVFHHNSSGGMVQSDYPTSTRISWDHVVEISQQADRMGLEAVIPVAKTAGFKGRTNHAGISYETLTFAAGIAQATENCAVFSTVQLPTVHPVLAAKATATIDHISGGRYGMNLTMGWYPPEIEPFRNGQPQLEHDERYVYGQEWLDVVEMLWDPTKDPTQDLAWSGKYFNFKDTLSLPHPIQAPRVPLINAGSSPAGQDFSARNVDINLVALPAEEMGAYCAGIKEQAAGYGREIDVWSYLLVICRDTEEEAKEVHRQVLEMGDIEGTQHLMKMLGMQTQSYSHAAVQEMQDRFIAGGGAVNLIGTPAQVAEQFAEYHELGLGGALMGFVDYLPDLQHFEAQVLPEMKRLGIRL